MTVSQNPELVDLSEKLFVIEQKKRLLQSVFRFSQMINRLLESVEAIGSLSASSFQLPPKIASFYRGIYGRYKHDPSARIEHNLFEIEKRVQQDFDAIIRLSKINEVDFQSLYWQAEKSNDKPKFWHVVDIFKRRLQTGVSLRLILRERGISHKKLEMNISEEFLEEKIEKLEIKEKTCIQNIKLQMNSLVDDIDLIFTAIDVENEGHQSLVVMRKGLITNLAHLNAGKSIEHLPYEFEIVVEQDDELSETDDVEEIPSASADSFVIICNQVAQNLDEIKDSKLADDKNKLLLENPKPKGFFAKLWQWLNSPAGVSWTNLKKDE